MNKVNLLFTDDLAELSFVQAYGDRVSAFCIHTEEFAAKALEFGLQPSTSAGKEGAATRLDNGLGDFQHGALNPARRKLGRDLQDHPVLHIRKVAQYAALTTRLTGERDDGRQLS